MRMSCNGCRVLRKGCSPDCKLRPCLEWLKSAKSQANATFFLAKFYGRAGLFNLINAGPPHLRPDIFKSLLYEACGRIIDPINGAAGLMYSGDWPRCQAAVAVVLEGGQLIKQASAASLNRRRIRKRSSEVRFTITGWGCGEDDEGFLEDFKRSQSHDFFSVGTVLDVEPVPQLSEVGLELTLGFNPVLQTMINVSD